MSEFEGHTPGPWRWTVSDRICSDADESPVLVCRLPLSTDKRGDTPQQTIDRWKADAHLIAAAPDLLAERDRLAALVKEARVLLDVDIYLHKCLTSYEWITRRDEWLSATTEGSGDE